ncbi:alpha-glucosidase/alpha-galactosidase, partial [candidate division KSB1 bacterium]|nr:alpha-glucosidase/alpha-galactosidase [candidate division KSB1 bacterium]
MRNPDEENKPIPVRIAYIGGGSRNWAHFLMNDLLLHDGFTGEIRLYDIDPSMADLNARFGNWLQSHPKAASKWHYKAVPSLKQALEDADFVFASIQPGSIELMKIDLEEPEQYGIYQAVGDTVGPGGSIRSLRAIRDYRVIAEAVAEHAADAWVLNFSNPMSVCTRTLFETFPGIKAFACCHEVFGTQKMLAKVYSKMTGEPAPPRQDIDINVLGINHFTWIDRAAYNDTDLLKLLSEYIRQPGILRPYSRQEIEKAKNVYINHYQVTYELFRRFGVLPAAGDRHLAEFVPWFLTSEDSCFRWGFCLTPYSFRWQQYSQSPEKFREMMKRREFPEPAWSGE